MQCNMIYFKYMKIIDNKYKNHIIKGNNFLLNFKIKMEIKLYSIVKFNGKQIQF